MQHYTVYFIWKLLYMFWVYHPKHVEQFPDKINCVMLHLVGYILEYIGMLFSETKKEWNRRGQYTCACVTNVAICLYSK